jgi:hypothetical protein
MRKIAFVMILTIGFLFTFLYPLPPTQAQKDVEKQFMKLHQKEMETFMNKCSGCHSLQRIFAKKRTAEEWDKILKQMAGKPHAMISEQELKQIRKWVDLMESAMTVGP